MTTPNPPTPIRIDFVSDVSCPWCAVGLKSLEQAVDRLEGGIEVEMHFQPFELNPQMPPEGENSTEHLMHKYGSEPEQVDANREVIRARGEALGFTFRMNRESRVYNTFDAHRLLHWAGLEGKQRALKHILLRAYFSDGENVASHETLARLAAQAGLDMERAHKLLTDGSYTDEVRAQEKFYTDNGIHSVPAIIINRQHLISGGQPPEVFEQALRQIAASGRE
jgi:predicted DsbA family dithiol-disulfide isomerase